jgi:hypothetical protein
MGDMTLDSVVIEVDDRVAAMRDGTMSKGRVAMADTDLGLYVVTFAKGDVGKTYNRSDLLPLYRHVGNGTVPLCFLPVAK